MRRTQTPEKTHQIAQLVANPPAGVRQDIPALTEEPELQSEVAVTRVLAVDVARLLSRVLEVDHGDVPHLEVGERFVEAALVAVVLCRVCRHT